MLYENHHSQIEEAPEGPTYFTTIPSPVGKLMLVGKPEVLSGIYMLEGTGRVPHPDPSWIEDPTIFTEPILQLGEFFSGQRHEFELRLAPEGTEWQKRVWSGLLDIPYGETRSYGELAAAIGHPKSSRAVGSANGRNPLPIVIPCHRVVGADGTLTGYSAGVKIKEHLLGLEAG